MWIAIVYERAAEVIAWNIKASEDQAVDWVIGQFYPKDTTPADTETDALKVIEQDGYVVHLELVQHLGTDIQHGIRFPNDLVEQKHDYAVKGAEDQANGALLKAGSAERVERVKRSVLYTDWTELG